MAKPYHPTKADRYRQIRLDKGLTQVQWARLLETGYMTVSRWENGRMKPPARAEKLMEAIALGYYPAHTQDGDDE